MDTRNYWHMQMHPDDQSFSDDHVDAILEHQRIIGLGDWAAGEGSINAFINDMNVNDVVAIKNGKKLIALVQVTGGAYQVKDDTTETGWIVHRRPIRILDWAIEAKTLPQPMGTLNPCASDAAETTRIIKSWHQAVLASFRKRKINPRV